MSHCGALTVRASGDKAKEKLACYTKGAPVDPSCLSKAEEKYSSSFAKAETKGDCTTLADGAAIEAKVDAFVGDVATELQPVDKCGLGEFKATGDKTDVKLDCLAAIPRDGLPADPRCFVEAEFEFTAEFASAERIGDCLITGDAAAIEAKVDAFVDDVSTELVPDLP